MAVIALMATSGYSADGATHQRRAQISESYAAGLRPLAVAIGDFNGDKALDVAVVNSGDGTATVLLAQSRRFLPGRTFSAGKEPCDIAAADLDRDGDLDLVIANHETSSFTVLSNDGRARFAPAPGSPFATGARPHIHSVTAADFDGDGWVDVAVESADTQEVRLRRGGKSGFGNVIPIPVRTMPYFKLGSADVTGDGISDVLVPGHGDRTVRTVTRKGASFVLAPLAIATPAKPWVVLSAKLNNDNRPDLVVVESDSVSFWLRSAKGYEPAPESPFQLSGATAIAIGRLDEDELDDIVIGPWEGKDITVVGSKTLKPRRIRACGRPTGLAIADLDLDGTGDLVVACATEARIVVLRSLLR